VWDIYFSISFVVSKNISKFLLFQSFLGSENHQKSCIFFRCMMTTTEEQLYGFYQFPGLKKHWEEKYFLHFLVSRNVFKKEYFCQFLASKFITKYGIVSTYSVTFVSRKFFTCLQ